MPFGEVGLARKAADRLDEIDIGVAVAGDRLTRVVAHADEVQRDLAGSGYTLAQAAIKWVLAHPAVSTVMVSADGNRIAVSVSPA